ATHPMVNALVLTGSRADAARELDALSDYDVEVLVTSWESFQQSDEWLRPFGEVLIRWPIHPQTTFSEAWLTRLVVFQDKVRIDFQIESEAGATASHPWVIICAFIIYVYTWLKRLTRSASFPWAVPRP
ncbi:MAG: aminoglycoside 6-adenylyltransferase, partial [Pseudomonadota bacterium]